MKKIKILGLVTMMLILIACNNGNEDACEGGLSTLVSVDPDEGVETERVEDVLDNMLSLEWGSDGVGLVLIDVLTGEVMGEFDLEESLGAFSLFNFSNGYFGARIGNERERECLDDGCHIWSVDLEGEHDYGMRYLVFDRSLDVAAEFFVTDENLQEAWMISQAVYADGELIVYHVPDWWDVYIDTGEAVSKIYRYYTNTGVSEVVFEMPDRLLIADIQIIDDGIFAFTARRFHDEHSQYYGFIEIESGNITYFSSQFNTSGMHVAYPHLLLNENVMPAWAGGVATGEVIVANLHTGETSVIQLDGEESMSAQLSLDGRHIVVIDETRNYFRKYEIASGELVVEIPVNIEGDWGSTVIPVTNSKFVIHSITYDDTNALMPNIESEYREIVEVNN